MTRASVARRGSPGLAALAGIVLGGCGSSPSAPSDTRISGVYTLQVVTGCSALPEDVQTRTYVARIDGSVVTLSGATFWNHPSRGLVNTFQIGVNGDNVGLVINQPQGLDIKGIVEETAPDRFFHFIGTGSGSIRSSGSGRVEIEGKLSAGFGWGIDVLRDSGHVGCQLGNASTFKFTPATTGFPAPGIARTLQRLQIVGPTTMAPGESAQFAATGFFPDGSTSDISASVEWHTPFPEALQITKSGSASAKAFGETNITAFTSVPNLFAPLAQTREIVVVPTNTFRIIGKVLAGTPPQAVFDADVTVTAGVAAGLSTKTRWDGTYALYGVSGPSEIQASKAGYPSQQRSISVQSHQALDITLPTVTVPIVSGMYSLAISADPSCHSPLPPPLNTRTYIANIAQSGRNLTVTLDGAPFVVREGRGNGFPGTVDPEQLVFQIDDNDHFGVGANPDVVELLGGTRVLMLFGTLSTDITPNRLTGRLSGDIVPADRASGNGFFWGPFCSSSSHPVVFTR